MGRKGKVLNYGNCQPQLDDKEVDTARSLGLVNTDLQMTADGATYRGHFVDKVLKNIGVERHGSQEALQARWREYARQCGFQIYIASNSTKPNNCGNAKYRCKKLNGDQFFDETAADDIVCPFYVNVSSTDGNWRTTEALLCHNHLKHVGFSGTPLVESTLAASTTAKRSRVVAQGDLSSMVVREMLPLHNHSTRTMTGHSIQTFFKSKGLTVNKSTVSRVKESVEEALHGEMLASYQKLRGYFEKMAEKNPNSLWRLEKSAENVFQRACFVPSVGIHIAKNSKPLYGFDGAHLKGDMNKKGVYLVATAKDYDDHITPFAMALVPVENYDHWRWFLTVIKEALGDVTRFTVLSDRQKGLLSAVELTFPEAGHRFCLQHIQANIVSNGIALTDEEKLLITKMAKSDDENQYEYLRSVLNSERPAAVTYLDKIEKKHWVKYMFYETFNLPTFDESTSNLSEQANNWIGNDCRSATPLDAFALYFNKLGTLISSRRQSIGRLLAAKTEANLVTTAQKQLDKCLRYAEQCEGEACLGEAYQIIHPGEAKEDPTKVGVWRIVDLPGRECTCGNWMDMQFPCVHSLKAASLHGQRIETLYDSGRFSIGHQKFTYFQQFMPWPTDVVLRRDLDLLLPPTQVVEAERGTRGLKPGPKPKHKRLKSKGGK